MTKKAASSADRQMAKGKKNKSKNTHSSSHSNKQFLLYTVVGIVGFIFISGVIAYLSSTTSVQNLATVMPHGSVMLDQMAGRKFSSPGSDMKHTASSTQQQHYSANHPQIQIPSPGGNGPIFADARSTGASRQQQEKVQKQQASQSGKRHRHNDSVISLDSNFNNMNSNKKNGSTTSLDNRIHHDGGKFSDYKYNYYYYDSNSQAFHLHDEYTTYPAQPVNPSPESEFQASLALPGRYQPSLCSDGHTIGFSDLSTLRNAIRELNDAYNLAVTRWEHYNSALAEFKIIKFKHQHDFGESSGGIDIEAPPPLPDHLMGILQMEPDPFIICPHTTLKASLGRHMPIFIDAEDVVVECDTCVLDTPGSHFSFGPHAKNVFVRGVTMMGATETSIIFRYNGAEVSFEDCYWVNNDSDGMNGSVADVNSTSVVKFYRCEISDVKQSSRTGIYNPNKVASSLTLRG